MNILICKKCGAKLDENSRFCSQCGADMRDCATSGEPGEFPKDAGAVSARFCINCGARLPENCAACLICGTKAGESPLPPELGLDISAPAAHESAVRKHPKILFPVCAAIFILLAVSASVIWLVQILPELKKSDSTPLNGAILYMTSENSLKFKVPSNDAPDEVLSDYRAETEVSGQGLAKISPNGRYIAYLDGYKSAGGGSLYLRDFLQKRPADGAAFSDILLAEHVSDGFFFTENSSKLVYLTFEGALCVTDFNESPLLDENVSKIIDHNNSHVIYAKGSGENFELYVSDVASGSFAGVLIDEGVLKLADYTPAFDKFIYVRSNPGGGRDLSSYDLKQGKPHTLAVGIDDVIMADAATTCALYRTSAGNTLNYHDLIYDEFYTTDIEITEPDLDKYPLLKELYEESDSDSNENSGMYSEDIAEESARFQSDLEAYDNKRKRDRMREQAVEAIDEFVSRHPTLYDLHLFRDGESVKLDSGSLRPFDDAGFDIGADLAVWTSTGLKNIKQIPISQYSETLASSTLPEYINNSISDSFYIQQSGSSPAPIYLGEGSFRSGGWRITEKADGIYFAMGNGNSFSKSGNNCDLYYAPIRKGSALNIVQIDQNVDAIGPILADGRLLYYKDRNGDICDLYLLTDMNIDHIGDNISLSDNLFMVKNANSTLIYLERYEPSTGSGTLYMLTKQNRQLATGVHRVFYRSDSLVYFLRSIARGKGELYSFGSNGLELVDTDVISVFE